MSVERICIKKCACWQVENKEDRKECNLWCVRMHKKNASKTQKTLAKNENCNMFKNLTFKKETKAKGQNQPHTICFRIKKKKWKYKD